VDTFQPKSGYPGCAQDGLAWYAPAITTGGDHVTDRRFTDEQVKVLFQGYCQGQLARIDLQEVLGIGKSRFFALLKAYRQNPERFTIADRRSAPARLSPDVEDAIKTALLREKAIVEDPDLPISSYNYTAIQDRSEVCLQKANQVLTNAESASEGCRGAASRLATGRGEGSWAGWSYTAVACTD
jgi:hypothetical protein